MVLASTQTLLLTQNSTVFAVAAALTSKRHEYQSNMNRSGVTSVAVVPLLWKLKANQRAAAGSPFVTTATIIEQEHILILRSRLCGELLWLSPWLPASRGARAGWAAWCDGACSQACHDGCSHPTTNFRLKTWFSLKVLAGERFNRWAAELASWKRLTLAFDMSTLTGQSETITSMALITRLYAVQLVASAEIESILS